MRLPRLATIATAAVLAVGCLAACSDDGPAGSADPGASSSATPAVPSESPTDTGSVSPSATPELGGTIAVLQPDSGKRRVGFDRREFRDRVAELCPACEIDRYVADGDASQQADQFTTAMSSGAAVIVLDAVDPFTVTTLVRSAQEVGITVIGYDTLLEDLDFYVGFDRVAGGRLQARALLRETRRRGNLVMLNGSPTDPAAVQVKQGAHEVFATSEAAVVAELDAVDGKVRATRTWLANLLAFYPPDLIQGVHAGSDDLAGEAITALVAAGARRRDLPPVTGQGASLAGIRRIVAGRQLMTVYRPVGPASDKAAEVAVSALSGQDPGPATDLEGVPGFLIRPVAVAKANVAETVVADGYWPVERICGPRNVQECRQAGLR